MVDGQTRARTAVLAGPAVAGEDGAAGDLAAVDVPRYADVLAQADDGRPGHRHALGMQLAVGALDDLRLGLEQQDDGAANGADVDRFVRRVQDEHTATLRSAPPVLVERRGPHWAWWYDRGHETGAG